MTATLLWLASIVLIAAGLVGIALPALPGTALILGGILLGAWIDDFARVGAGTLTVIGVIAVVAWVLDYVASLLGAKKAGASRLALVGAALGTVAGLMFGLVGVLFMPLVGAAIGEYIARRRAEAADGSASGTAPPQGQVGHPAHVQAVRVGVATWLGLMAGMLAKVVLSFVMVGIFVVALIW